MHPRIVGYAVLVYVAFTSGTILDLARVAAGLGNEDGWALIDAALWLALAAGGLGWILGRSWCRAAVLAGAAGSILRAIALVWLVLPSGAPSGAALFSLVMILPPAAILAGALSLRAPGPGQVEPSPVPAGRSVVSARIDLAYGCFALIATVLCGFRLLSVLPLEFGTLQGIGMVIGIPAVLAAVAAGLLGVALAIVEWRVWPLPTMAVATASMLLVFVAGYEGAQPGRGMAPAWNLLCTGLLVFLCIRWFAFTRRRAVAAARPR